MKLTKLITTLSIFLLISCGGLSRDTELETKISSLVESEEIVVMNTFGQIVVNISSKGAFDMAQADRQKLAEKLAMAALEMHSDSNTVTIGFGRVEPEIQQIAYAWKNENGKLIPIQ